MPESEDGLATSAFDAFLDGLDYPMYVVTAASKDTRGGCLVGFASQVSIDPPRFLVCISARNHTHSVARDAVHLAVHLLGPRQLDLARLFGEETGDEVDKLSRCRWRSGPDGVPILEDCPRHFVGRVVARSAFGDHTGFLLEPTELASSGPGPVLTFTDVKDMSPGHGA